MCIVAAGDEEDSSQGRRIFLLFFSKNNHRTILSFSYVTRLIIKARLSTVRSSTSKNSCFFIGHIQFGFFYDKNKSPHVGVIYARQ